MMARGRAPFVHSASTVNTIGRIPGSVDVTSLTAVMDYILVDNREFSHLHWILDKGIQSATEMLPSLEQEAQLSQTDHATLRVIEYFAKSPKVTQSFEITLLSRACVSPY